MPISYSTNRPVTVAQFVDVLRRSSLAERRPVDDLACMQAMLEHGNLLCTAWDDDLLVGVARSVTDFAYCCYLSDLAVDARYQQQGIGKELVSLTRSALGPRANLILLSAPKAVAYYPKIGFHAHPSAWVIASRDKRD